MKGSSTLFFYGTCKGIYSYQITGDYCLICTVSHPKTSAIIAFKPIQKTVHRYQDISFVALFAAQLFQSIVLHWLLRLVHRDNHLFLKKRTGIVQLLSSGFSIKKVRQPNLCCTIQLLRFHKLFGCIISESSGQQWIENCINSFPYLIYPFVAAYIVLLLQNLCYSWPISNHQSANCLQGLWHQYL